MACLFFFQKLLPAIFSPYCNATMINQSHNIVQSISGPLDPFVHTFHSLSAHFFRQLLNANIK